MALSVCPLQSDNRFGPRVNVQCRSFDFTLLFEDAFFSVLPAALFLLFVPARLRSLTRASVKLTSNLLALWKLVGKNK